MSPLDPYNNLHYKNIICGVLRTEINKLAKSKRRRQISKMAFILVPSADFMVCRCLTIELSSQYVKVLTRDL